MSARRADLLSIALLIALAALLFADVLFLGSNFAGRDLFLYHFPMKRVVHDLIARGEFPWWNPYIAGGQPMAANPAYEIFYPPQLLIFVGSYEFGFALHIVFHVWLALAGTFLFFRELPLNRAAAFFGALSFGLGGFFLGSATTLPTFFVWSWAGLVAWAMLRWLRGGSFALAAVIAAMPMLVGEPVALAQLWVLIVVGMWREWRRIALLVVTAAGIAAVQLVPMIDHVGDSARSRGLPYANVVAFSMAPDRPLELVMPHAFGRIDPEHPQWRGGLPYLLSIYCGLGVVLFAVAGFVTRAPGAMRTAAVLVVSYVLAIGGHTPLFRWLYAIGVRSIRYPEKFMMGGLVALVVFATVAFDHVVKPRLWRLVVVALVVVDVARFANEPIPRMPRNFFTPPPAVAAFDPARDDYAVFHRGEWTGRPRADSPLWLARDALHPFTPAAWGLRGALEADIDETQLLPTHDLLDSMKRLANSGYARWADPFVLMANVRYVIDYGGDPIRVTRIPNRGRYWFAAAARILTLRETSSSATLDVEANGPAFLVITITRHKYWRATIDGRAAPLVPANIAFQGLIVPAGRHRIELRYRNPLVFWGAGVSGVTLLGAVIASRRRRVALGPGKLEN
ncbi:MAG TPA: YfhO family protein [Thermoanaerobaculia bacterium]|nr:YfhO family protein [Thermoanaerobaculia bacterium]